MKHSDVVSLVDQNKKRKETVTMHQMKIVETDKFEHSSILDEISKTPGNWVMRAIARYQAAAINFGLKIATNPAAIKNSIDFTKSFIGTTLNEKTGMAPSSVYSLYGKAVGAAAKRGWNAGKCSLFSKEKAEAINNMSFSDALSTDLSSGFSDSSGAGRGGDGINSGDFSDSGNGEGGDSDGNNSGGFGGGGHGGIR